MEITVKSNTISWLENKIPEFKAYSVYGQWSSDFNQNTINWRKDEHILGRQQGQAFYKMCENIQGCDYSDLNKIFKSYAINLSLAEDNIQEADIIKSIANTFLWIQYFFSENFDVETDPMSPRIFDDFKLDIKSKPGTVKDIYYLPKKYSRPEKMDLLNNLMNMNLLSHLKVSSNQKTLENYFIPLTKPGYRKETFINSETYELWNEILIDRHHCLNSHFNKK